MRDINTATGEEIAKLFKVCGIPHKMKTIENGYVVCDTKTNTWSGLIELSYSDFAESGYGDKFMQWAIYYGFIDQIDWDNVNIRR